MLDALSKPSFVTEIDTAAEREAAAISWLANELGIAPPATLFERRRQAPIARHPRYPMTAALRANERIHRYYRARIQGRPAKPLAVPFYITTTEDRARRQQRRERRKALLTKLGRTQQRWVPFGQALKLCDMATRTLHKAIRRGAVHRIRQDGQILVATADLRTYLKQKVAA